MSTAVLCAGLFAGCNGCERHQAPATGPVGPATPATTSATAAALRDAGAESAAAVPVPIVVAARVPRGERAGSGTLEFIPETFEQLYPWLLVRRSMPAGDKATLWHARYNGRWVRWSGMVMSITPNGLTLKQLATTTTYDVSLWLEADSLQRSRRLRKGDRVTYVGRLDAYDDVLRHLLVTHGTLVENADVVGPPAPLPTIPPEALTPPAGTHGGGPAPAALTPTTP
jgi:hypothetical protein